MGINKYMKLLSIGKNQNYFLCDELETILTEEKYIKIILAIPRLLKYNNKTNLLKGKYSIRCDK